MQTPLPAICGQVVHKSCAAHETGQGNQHVALISSRHNWLAVNPICVSLAAAYGNYMLLEPVSVCHGMLRSMAFRQAGELQTTSRAVCLKAADSNMHKSQDTQQQQKHGGK